VIERVPMSPPDITDEDVQAVAEVVRSGRLTLGPKTEEFERKRSRGVIHYQLRLTIGGLPPECC